MLTVPADWGMAPILFFIAGADSLNSLTEILDMWAKLREGEVEHYALCC